MATYVQKLKQFLLDEKELLRDFAEDVANADTDHDYKKAKARYDAQRCRVNAIEEALNLVFSEIKVVS